MQEQSYLVKTVLEQYNAIGRKLSKQSWNPLYQSPFKRKSMNCKQQFDLVTVKTVVYYSINILLTAIHREEIHINRFNRDSDWPLDALRMTTSQEREEYNGFRGWKHFQTNSTFGHKKLLAIVVAKIEGKQIVSKYFSRMSNCKDCDIFQGPQNAK